MMISCESKIAGVMREEVSEYEANRELEGQGGGDAGRRGQNSFHLCSSTSKATSTPLWFHQHLLSEEEEEEEGETGGGDRLPHPHMNS